MVAITARNPMMWRYCASRDSRYCSSLAPMIAFAHRALDCAVSAPLRLLSRSRRNRRRASASRPAAIGSGRHTAARSARRNRPT